VRPSGQRLLSAGAERGSFFTVQPNLTTNAFNFTYANRTALTNAGWDFIARAPVTWTARNTETTAGASPRIVLYNQGGALRIPAAGRPVERRQQHGQQPLPRLGHNWVSVRLNVSFAPAVAYQQVNWCSIKTTTTPGRVPRGWRRRECWDDAGVLRIPSQVNSTAVAATNCGCGWIGM